MKVNAQLHSVIVFTDFLDFKISPSCECCILSFGWFPGVWILCADVSEHSVTSSYVLWTRTINTLAISSQFSSCPHHLWRWNRRRGITQKKEYSTHRYSSLPYIRMEAGQARLRALTGYTTNRKLWQAIKNIHTNSCIKKKPVLLSLCQNYNLVELKWEGN
jgi:hypothetical protein